MTDDPSVVRYLGGRKFTLCLVVALILFVCRLTDDIDGAQLLTGLGACLGVNSGGNLLQRWWERATS